MPKRDILNSFSETHSQSQTARILGISRQRVHQVVRGYKNFGTSGREKRYNQAWKDTCKVCHKNPTVALHHIDKNNKNDEIKNLLPVCKTCHYELHISKKWSRNFNKCIFCGTSDKKEKRHQYAARGLCNKCYQRALRNPKNPIKPIPIYAY